MHQPLSSLTLLLLSLALAACSQETSESKGPGPGKETRHLVETMPVREQALVQEVDRTGSLRARREIRVQPLEEGRLVELPYYEGDTVEKGALLLRLDDTLLQAQLKKATAQRQQAALDLQRLSRLQGSRVVSEEDLARASTALDVAKAEEELLHTRLGYTRIHAPFDGIISARLAEPGDVLQRFAHVLTLIDPTSLVTEVTLSELFLPALAVGDPVEVRIDALGSQRFAGTIVRIHPAVDPQTRQGTVEITLEPAPPGALAGQLCRVTLRGRPQPRLLIPFAALQNDLQGEYVYLVEDGKAVRREVVSGAHFDEQVEIIEGIAAGQAVITKGLYNLYEGKAVETVSATGDQPAS